MRTTWQLAAAAAAVFVAGQAAPLSAQSQEFTVDCSRGQTITQALNLGTSRERLVLNIKGTCTEAVTIARDDVTIQGRSGATVKPPLASQTVITVRATRIFIDGLTITGGAFGITVVHALDVAIDNMGIQSAGQSGVNLLAGHASISNSMIQNNGGHGIALSQASALVNNNQILSNGGSGIYAQSKSAVRANGNTVSNNGVYGIYLLGGSDGLISGGTISGNGTNSATPAAAKGGASVQSSTAQFSNTSISNSLGRGLTINNGSYVDAFSITVTGSAAEGVIAYLGGIATINGGAISGNGGNGLWLGVHSTAQIGNNVSIMNNSQNGIQLSMGSKLWTFASPITVGGNTYWGLHCDDSESSAANLEAITFTPSNGAGSASCTGY
jgi:parallel beta-helix repeat protein